MTDPQIGLLLVISMVGLVSLGVHIAVALLLVSFTGAWLIKGEPAHAFKLVAQSFDADAHGDALATIPLFVLMGLLVSQSEIGKDIFTIVRHRLRRVPSGLALATVITNAALASATSMPTASGAILTKTAVTDMVRQGYTLQWATGSAAGSSMLAMVIPPSLLMIIYALLSEQSIGKLFVASATPALLITLGFLVVIRVTARHQPRAMGASGTPAPSADDDTATLTMRDTMAGLLPLTVLVAVVFAGLYGDTITPLETGSIGAFGALLMTLARRRLDRTRLWQILKETGHISVDILFILVAAVIYAKVLAMTGVSTAIADTTGTLGLGKWGFLLLYVLILVGLGCVLDSPSTLVMTVPVAAPVAQTLGFDLVHFGVMTVIAVECGHLMPPFGMAAFTLIAIFPDKRLELETIFAGALPFFYVMLATLALVAVLPGLSLALIR
jgi:tripartite ATP-independent transporter DctM subunit